MTDRIHPTIVHVLWSEAGRAICEEDDVMPFEDFEARARAAAMGHTTGGYLKTKIVVHLSDGSTYGCRIDLAPHDTHGFQHHAEMFLAGWDREGETRGMPEVMRDSYRDCAEHLRKIDFTPQWVRWEVEDLSRPVDRSFCPRIAYAKPVPTYRTDLTRAGEQYVIPGCEVDAAPAARQMSLF